MQDSFKILCKTCDLIVNVPNNSTKCTCPRCASSINLIHHKNNFFNLSAVAISALIFLYIAVSQPFLSLSTLGIVQNLSLFQLIDILFDSWAYLLIICVSLTFVLPIFVLITIICVGIFHYKLQRTWLNIYSFCYFYCMVDVFVLGVLVSLVKLTSLADVDFHIGFISCFIFSFLLLICLKTANPKTLWDYCIPYIYPNIIGETGKDSGYKLCMHCNMVLANNETICPRCNHHVYYRKQFVFQRVIALLITSIILYIPANVYPIMFTEYLGASLGSNIVDGVITLWNMNSQFVALVIFIASIFIPIFKILSIAFIIYSVRLRGNYNKKLLTKLYHFISFIGKWSMIDVFVVIIMSSIVRFSSLLTISPGIAIVLFAFVVFFTMLAVEAFDERFIWDKK